MPRLRALAGHATEGEDDRCGQDAEDDDDNQKLDEGEARLELDALAARLDVADVPNHLRNTAFRFGQLEAI